MRGKSSTTLNLARKKDDDDVFLNNNALSFIKPSSFLTNDDCVFREDGRYSNQRSIFGARVERTGKSFETRDGRKELRHIHRCRLLCVLWKGCDSTFPRLDWTRARLYTYS